jgi:hypothetical protein
MQANEPSGHCHVPAGDVCFPADADDFDFHIEASGRVATVAFVRLIKL